MITMEDKIYRVVSDVMGIPISEITDESSPDTIEAWESLSHINLALAIEAEFKISLAPDDVLEMLSVGLIKTILIEKTSR